MFYGEALTLALKIWNSYQESIHRPNSVVVFGVIPQESELLKSKVIQNDLTPHRLKNPSQYIAAVRIPLSSLQSVNQLAEILSQFRVESLEEDFFLNFGDKLPVTAHHYQTGVMYKDKTFPVIFRYRNEFDDEEDPQYPDRGIVDIMSYSGAFKSLHSARLLKRAIRLIHGS